MSQKTTKKKEPVTSLVLKGVYEENVRGIPVALEWQLNEKQLDKQVVILKEIIKELQRCANVLADKGDKQLQRSLRRWRNQRLQLYALHNLRYLFKMKKQEVKT